MRARAPGKLVLSGAYSVLEGAPALVAAVDRYVEADGDRGASFEPPEVLEAQRRGVVDRVPWFDASALRSDERKLGLGSSAAIVAACLAAAGFEEVAEEDLAAAIFPEALAAHRAAQGGGSGVDVAAACYGGVIRCELRGEELAVRPHRLPAGLEVRIFSCGRAASTRDMIARVHQLRGDAPSRYHELLSEAGRGAEEAAAAKDVPAFVSAIRRQLVALEALGRAAGAPIVIDEVVALDRLARSEGACFAPSGAGGGDVAVYFGPTAPGAAFQRAAEEASLVPVAIEIGARGLHRGP